ncbi:MAG: LysR family transcriptional regulator [Lachnospiraceae bacterium]|nr:LysR family transcriptional regulator [Lachnospiraceae bacterium]
MTFKQLEYVLEIARQGSFSVAARKLFISQPALSRSVREVENEFNIVLFDRNLSPVMLTPAGQVFVQRGQMILDALAELKQELGKLDDSAKELVVGVSDSGALLMRQILPEYRMQHPNVKLSLIERELFMSERMLEVGKLDLLFSLRPSFNMPFRTYPLWKDDFMVALPRTHAISRRQLEETPDILGPDGRQRFYPLIDLNECRDVKFVTSNRDRLKTVQLTILRSFFEPEIACEAENLVSIIMLASAEPCGTILPRMFARLYEREDKPLFFRFRGQTPPWIFTLSLLHDAKIDRAAYEFIKLFLIRMDEMELINAGMSVADILKDLEGIIG